MAKPRHLRLSKRVVDRLLVEAEPGGALALESAWIDKAMASRQACRFGVCRLASINEYR